MSFRSGERGIRSYRPGEHVRALNRARGTELESEVVETFEGVEVPEQHLSTSYAYQKNSFFIDSEISYAFFVLFDVSSGGPAGLVPKPDSAVVQTQHDHFFIDVSDAVNHSLGLF